VLTLPLVVYLIIPITTEYSLFPRLPENYCIVGKSGAEYYYLGTGWGHIPDPDGGMDFRLPRVAWNVAGGTNFPWAAEAQLLAAWALLVVFVGT
jgi:hypothetical protein